MRFVVLVNGAAGSVTDDVVADIEAAFAATDATADVQVVDPEDLGKAMTSAWAADPQPDAVVVAGGDGTVGGAAGHAAGTDVVLGVLPLGTFNHFAKDLGVPTDLAEAALALASGEVREVDVAEVNGRVFVNNSVVGLYPEMVALRERISDARGWGKVRAVPVAAWNVFLRFPIHRMDLSGPGYQRARVRTPSIFIGNGVYDSDAGAAPARHRIDAGVLGVAVARVVSRFGLIAMVVRALTRGTREVRELDTVELTELTVKRRTRHLRVAVDGETCWMDTPLHYRVRPGDLRVLAPAQA